MKKSASVKLTLVVAVATFAAACENEDARRCVDKDRQIVVDDKFCQQDGGARPSWMPVYIWYYGGSGGTTWGGRYAGGSFTPTPHTSYFTPSTRPASSGSSTIRGGFGSSAHSSFGG